jgi:hypothetical protein
MPRYSVSARLRSRRSKHLTIYRRLLSSSTTAQELTAVATASVAEPPTKCITITSHTPTATCLDPRLCPAEACPQYVIEETQPCGCPTVIPAVYVGTSCCPGCQIPTDVAIATNCPTTTPRACATITTTNPPACHTAGPECVTPACILVSTLALGCDCSGISTVTECEGNGCPGCATSYRTVYPPCPIMPTS